MADIKAAGAVMYRLEKNVPKYLILIATLFCMRLSSLT